jgi:hypothetical protein
MRCFAKTFCRFLFTQNKGKCGLGRLVGTDGTVSSEIEIKLDRPGLASAAMVRPRQPRKPDEADIIAVTENL